jgi:LytR cell envelope-related transcriptional attenuator
MSNSTRPGGYDERLVVPLEASRRGAHRARVNPLLSVLPLLAVVVVVVAVVGLAYTLFVKGNGSDDNGTASAPTTSAPAATQPTPSVAASSGASSSTKPSASASSSSTASTAKVDKTTAFKVYNGSTTHVQGLAKRADTAIAGAGFSKGEVVSGATPVGMTQSTKVYYGSSSQKATAEAMKEALGGVGVVKLNPGIAGQAIVVVVGDDYAG